jgi:hypothetical protein
MEDRGLRIAIFDLSTSILVQQALAPPQLLRRAPRAFGHRFELGPAEFGAEHYFPDAFCSSQSKRGPSNSNAT